MFFFEKKTMVCRFVRFVGGGMSDTAQLRQG